MQARLTVFCALLALTVAASANVFTNASFEMTPDGTTVSGVDFGGDSSTFANWRVFAVSGAGATYRVTSAAASHGAVGMEIARDVAGGDTALDKWDLWEPIAPERRIYKYLVDARDGGAYGGATLLNLGAQFEGGPYGPGIGFDPSGQWETLGLTGHSGTNGGIGVRLDVPRVGESAYLDNVRAIDVTQSDRMVNGGFENSDIRPLNWRFFEAGATGSATISGDAHEGNNAVLLSRTDAAGDSGLDLDRPDLRVAALGGETVTLDFASKKVSGDANTRLKLNIVAFDDGGAVISELLNDLIDVAADDYTEFTRSVALPSNTAHVNIAFRVADDTFAGAVGSYLIDGVTFVPEPTAAILLVLGMTLSVGRRR